MLVEISPGIWDAGDDLDHPYASELFVPRVGIEPTTRGFSDVSSAPPRLRVPASAGLRPCGFAVQKMGHGQGTELVSWEVCFVRSTAGQCPYAGQAGQAGVRSDGGEFEVCDQSAHQSTRTGEHAPINPGPASTGPASTEEPQRPRT